jgi:hypothetical protein
VRDPANESNNRAGSEAQDTLGYGFFIARESGEGVGATIDRFLYLAIRISLVIVVMFVTLTAWELM